MVLGTIALVVVAFGAIIISALPLYLAVKALGGKTSILKTFLINIIGGLAVSLVNYFFETWGGILAFIVLLFIYMWAFKLGPIRAFFAWLLQFVIVAVLYIIGGIIVGASVLNALF